MRTITAVLALCCSAWVLAAQANRPISAYASSALSLVNPADQNARAPVQVETGTPVEVVACDGAWCRITVNGMTGYLPRLSLATQQGVAMTEGRTGHAMATIAGMKCNLRSLAVREEEFFSDSARYTTSLDELPVADDSLCPGSSASVELFDPDLWRGTTQSEEAPGVTCGIYAGYMPPFLPGQQEATPLCWEAATRQPDSARLAAAKSLLDASGGVDAFVAGVKLGWTNAARRQGSPGGHPWPAEFWPRFDARFMQSLPQMVDSVAVLVAQSFSLEDLNAVTAFWRSPDGQRAVALQLERGLEATAEALNATGFGRSPDGQRVRTLYVEKLMPELRDLVDRWAARIGVALLDSLQPPAPPPNPERSADRSSAAHGWQVMRGPAGILLTLQALNPIPDSRPDPLPTLVIRCHERLDIYVDTFVLLREDADSATRVRIQWGNQKAEEAAWPLLDNSSAFAPKPRAFLARVAGITRFRFEFRVPYDSAPRVAGFNVLGLDAYLAELKSACPPMARVFFESEVDEPPQVLSGPQLVYPDLLRQAGVQGRVIVQAIIDTSGRAEVASVKVLQSPNPGFDMTAEDYVRGAVFRPARVKGRKVRVLVNLPLDFKIRP